MIIKLRTVEWIVYVSYSERLINFKILLYCVVKRIQQFANFVILTMLQLLLQVVAFGLGLSAVHSTFPLNWSLTASYIGSVTMLTT